MAGRVARASRSAASALLGVYIAVADAASVRRVRACMAERDVEEGERGCAV
jgi:hypothetical protein